MNPDLSQKALDKIETLCGKGCSYVRLLLERANDGKLIEELAEFSHAEIKQILDELEKIMSVYKKRD